ncbi:MAG TPA: glutaredoxin family protein [Dehalococcoidia bacterium]|nr:glutaredoxin family protein [Dehalococcoidia bacterium]
MPQITVYSTTWCGYCRTLKMFLKQNDIPFDEVDIEDEPQYGPMIEKLTGGYRTVPTVKIGENYYVNPSARQLRELLGLGAGRSAASRTA